MSKNYDNQDENNNELAKKRPNLEVDDSSTNESKSQEPQISYPKVDLTEYRFNVRKEFFKLGLPSIESRIKIEEESIGRKLKIIEELELKTKYLKENETAANYAIKNNISTLQKKIPFSSLEWKVIKSIFKVSQLNYKPKFDNDFFPISREDFDFLLRYINLTKRTTPIIGNEKETESFIEPIFRIIADSFKNVSLRAQLNFSGELLPLSDKVAYCLKRPEREYFIIEVNKVEGKSNTENFENGMAQCFAAMETMAEVEKIEKVYGLVTNFYSWSFLEITNEGASYYLYKPHTLDDFITEEGFRELIMYLYNHMKKTFGERNK